MANYSKLRKIDIENIISEYNIKIESFKAVQGGSANSSFFIQSANGSYIFTIFDEKEREEAECFIKILQRLKENGFPATRTISRSNGEYLIEIDNKPAFLKHYIEGEVCSELNPGNLYELGSKLAELHTIFPLDCLPDRFSYGLESFSEITTRNTGDQFSEWLKEKEEELRIKIDTSIPIGFIHGDLFLDNVLFRDNKLEAIIDFEEACKYYFIFDIGMCIIGTCVTSGKINIEKVKYLIKGYSKIRKASEPEQECLKLFTEYAAVATCFWRYRQFNILNPLERREEDYIKMKNLSEHIRTMTDRQFKALFYGL